MQISREGVVLVAKSWARGGEVAANDEIITRSQAHTQLYTHSVWCAVCSVYSVYSVYSMQCKVCSACSVCAVS